MRRRRRHPEEPENRDRWLVSYSDFITVLFAFFVVLFACSYRDNQEIKKLSQAIHVGFQQLGAFSGGMSSFGVAYHNVTLNGSNPPVEIQAPTDEKDSSTKKQSDDNRSEATGVDIGELQKQLESAIGKEIRNHEVILRVTPEGFVISLKDLGFFNSGEAALMPGAADKIERIAKVLSQHGLDLRVEGHSDDQPIHTDEFRSNWELSTARATAVLMLLLNDSRIDPRKVSVAGYGQYRPIADNATPEGRQMNRRVDLVVVATTSPRPPALP
ncbi:MAG: flagellar motor protein MotB [Terracidiphilus sp.]|jgi:chemotaxis protein MotB